MDTSPPSQSSRHRKTVVKPFEKLIWTANSTAVLFGAFWLICVIQDFCVYVLGRVIGLPIQLEFDYMALPENATFSSSQILIITIFVPIYFLAVGILSGILYKYYRLKKDLRKLFFLWMQYISFGIFGGSFVTAFAQDGGAISVLWKYLRLNTDFLPIIAFAISTLLIFFGIFNLWKFLNIAPSSEINKKTNRRLEFILYIQVIPLILLFLVGMELYPNFRIASRLSSSLMVWVPVLSGIIASVAKDSGFSKVPAFKDSDVRTFQPLYWGFAALVYVAVLFLS